MANSKDQRRRKRLLLSSLLTIFTDETIVTMAFSPVQPVATDYDRNIGSKFILDSTDRSHISCRPRRHLKVILMNDPTSEDWIVEDRKRHAVESSHDLTKIRSKLASWSIQQLLSALNERSIRYPPTASRNDLENIFADYLIHCHESRTLEANDINRFQNVAADINLFHPTLSNKHNSNSSTKSPVSITRADLEERLHKRVQRRHQQQTRRDRFRKSMSNFLYTVVPSVTGNVSDFTKRKAKRLKRQVADFMLLDDETGVRDVVRYDFVRREQIRNDYAFVSDVVLGPGDAIEVIVNNSPVQPLPSEAKSRPSRKHREASPSDELYSTVAMRGSMEYLPSPTTDESSGGSNRFRLPPSSNGYQEGLASFSSPNYSSPPKRRRKKQIVPEKKIYNPYGNEVRDIIDDDKDAIDRVADFLTNTADQIFDRILVNENVKRSNNVDVDPRTREASSQAPFDSTTTSRTSQKRSSSANKKGSTHLKHWKDRLEERLDSMLGLHESGDFYRSWTERSEHDKDGNDEPYDAFSVAQGRKPPKRRGKSLYEKPFWEEDGNIFSLLFGRTQHYTPPRLDLRSGFQTGSLLSIFRFALQNFLVVASYLCRWASTQGALPQPVVVIGVSSAMLCARPHRRLFAAGVALLILRTVGEVLHGYVYGNTGWEDDNDETTTNTRAKEKTDTEHEYDGEF